MDREIKKLVLASASPRRRELLAQIGLTAEVVPSAVEENITTKVPEEAVMELSRQKAGDVARFQKAGTLIIGADTVVAAEGRILGKPDGHEAAFRMISMLEGKAHSVYTGVTLIFRREDGDRVKTFSEKTQVVLYPMTEQEIKAYAESGEPMDKAGAYAIQGKFAAFIKKVDGDYSNVVGLPVGRVYQEIKKMLEEEPE